VTPKVEGPRRHHRSEPLPLRPPKEAPRRTGPTPAPAWVALLAAWLGLLAFAAAVVFLFLPGSTNARAELQHVRPYSAKDRFLPFPLYGVAATLFVGIVVLWQMRKEPRPLPDALLAQRLQAWVGIALALAAACVIYGYVALFGPK
jgi:hypothetical protein